MLADPRFFARTGPHLLARLAEATGAEPRGPADRMLAAVAPLATAGPDSVSFLDNRRYLDQLAGTRAGAIILQPELAGRAPAGAALLVTAQPYLAWARACALFHPEPPARPGIHPSAVVDPAASLAPGCEVGALAVIGAGAEIGAGTRIGAHAVIGPGCVLGEACRIGEGASLSHAILGARVFVYPGARIGQPGFGFAPGPRGFETVPQLGRVLVGDDVEVGANTCIDRGSAGDTVVGAGTRIDNLVQIGHNVRIGRMCIIVAQAGISGSTELGDFVQMGAQAGLTGHLKVGERARIAAQSGVMSDLDAGAEVGGSPAENLRSLMQGVLLVRRLVAERRKGRAGRDGTG